jgi:hypothetical protein
MVALADGRTSAVNALTFDSCGGELALSIMLVFTHILCRQDGAGELYTYVPLNDENTSRLLAVPPSSKQNPDYGFSVGRCAWHFAAGVWYAVAERVKLNEPGVADGEPRFLGDCGRASCLTIQIHRQN